VLLVVCVDVCLYGCDYLLVLFEGGIFVGEVFVDLGDDYVFVFDGGAVLFDSCLCF